MRHYVRHLEGLSVTQAGRPLELQRLEPSSWLLHCDPDAGVIEVRYGIVATDLSVRTCHLDGDHGFLALAAVVMEVDGERWNPHGLQLALPEGWRAHLPLPEDGQGGWHARNFDQLVDTPIEAGPFDAHQFSVLGVPHRWVTWAGAAGQERWLLERHPNLLVDVEAVCRSCCALMGVVAPPTRDYLFILHLLDEGYGGLEHDDASVLCFGRRALDSAGGYRKLLQLVAHEYLHQWNVRRLRPVEITPIDYHRPMVVPSLWFAEGVTSYLDQLLPLHAGCSDPDLYLDELGEDLNRYLQTPGRAIQSLRDSSLEAWVKLYQADAYSPNNQISYYLKGAVVALVLDLHLRRHGKALAGVLRELWLEWGQWQRGYREEDLLEVVDRHCPGLADQLNQWLQSVDDPDLQSYLTEVGLRLEPVTANHPHLGASLRRRDELLQAVRVDRHGPAERAGLMVGDEVLALDGVRLRQPEQLGPLLEQDHQQVLLISRRGLLKQLELRSEAPVVERWQLRRDSGASEAALKRQRQWLELLPC